ncbi:uncharacterized protein LOC118439535 isoform X2 [Folsomia candida]|uniref:uncharacterized protein LOC118439535 isoform X2 n=1 Tax=Folsomia candida TaxID=158441 RepID=UPI001605564D|nr:uncharacterized protein LOC118439535 isoform X2 [Folsomia candida]
MDQSNSTHAIVHFPSDNTVEIVPINWINDQATHCQFPPSGEKGVKKIKKKGGVPLPHWATYEITILKYFASYNAAAEQLPKAITGNKLSDSEIQTGTRSKMSSTTFSSTLPVPPQVTTHRTEIVSSLESGNENGETTFVLPPEFGGSLILVSPEGQEYAQNIANTETNNSNSPNFINNEIMKEILVQVHQIKVTQNEHGRRLTNIQNLLSNRDRNPPVNPSYSFPRQFFPLKSKESLKALEEILKDPAPKIALKKLLSECGGNTLEDCLELMAKYLCLDEMLSQHSYHGRSGKTPFLNQYPELNQVVFEGLSQNDNAVPVTRKSVDEAFQKILKRGADRFGKKVKPPSKPTSNPGNISIVGTEETQ